MSRNSCYGRNCDYDCDLACLRQHRALLEEAKKCGVNVDYCIPSDEVLTQLPPSWISLLIPYVDAEMQDLRPYLIDEIKKYRMAADIRLYYIAMALGFEFVIASWCGVDISGLTMECMEDKPTTWTEAADRLLKRVCIKLTCAKLDALFTSPGTRSPISSSVSRTMKSVMGLPVEKPAESRNPFDPTIMAMTMDILNGMKVNAPAEKVPPPTNSVPSPTSNPSSGEKPNGSLLDLGSVVSMVKDVLGGMKTGPSEKRDAEPCETPSDVPRESRKMTIGDVFGAMGHCRSKYPEFVCTQVDPVSGESCRGVATCGAHCEPPPAASPDSAPCMNPAGETAFTGIIDMMCDSVSPCSPKNEDAHTEVHGEDDIDGIIESLICDVPEEDRKFTHDMAMKLVRSYPNLPMSVKIPIIKKSLSSMQMIGKFLRKKCGDTNCDISNMLGNVGVSIDSDQPTGNAEDRTSPTRPSIGRTGRKPTYTE